MRFEKHKEEIIHLHVTKPIHDTRSMIPVAIKQLLYAASPPLCRRLAVPPPWLLPARPASVDPHRSPRHSEGRRPARSATFFFSRDRPPWAAAGSSVWPVATCGGLNTTEPRRRRSDDEQLCHYRTSCHVKYFSQNREGGVERTLIGYMRLLYQDISVQFFTNAGYQ